MVGALLVRFAQAAHRRAILWAPLHYEGMFSEEGMSRDELDDSGEDRLVPLYEEVGLGFVGASEEDFLSDGIWESIRILSPRPAPLP